MAGSYIARLRHWRDQVALDLKERWWWVIVGPLLAFVYAVVEHRILEAINHFIDNHVSIAAVKPIMVALWSSPFLHPAMVALELFFVGVFVILAHAYWTTRPAKERSLGILSELDVKLIPAFGPSPIQLLTVENWGVPATLRAQCRLINRRNDPNLLHRTAFRMEWDAPQKRAVKLRRGGSCNLIVAKAGVSHEYLEWIEIWGLSGKRDGEPGEAKASSRWNRGNKLPEYDLEITIIGDNDKPHIECFTLKAGQAAALEMFAIACDSVTDADQPTRAVIGRSTNVTKRDWIGEWGESKREFTELENSDVFAEFFQGDLAIRSDRSPLMRDRIEAACELAGSRLFNSPGMVLSDTVRSQKEHWKRWLYFLKETQGFNRKISGSNDDGYIERLAQQSALACTKCAAKAFN